MQLDRPVASAPARAAREVPPIRATLGDNLGRVLTPELAADIESAHIATLHRRIERLEDDVIKAGVPPVVCAIRHHFAAGIYGREITIPAKVTVTGAVHRVENLVVVSKGRLEAATPLGIVMLSPGDTLRCEPGTKNVVRALEDARWTNFYANPLNLTDPDQLVEQLYDAKADEMLGGSENRQAKAWAQALEVET